MAKTTKKQKTIKDGDVTVRIMIEDKNNVNAGRYESRKKTKKTKTKKTSSKRRKKRSEDAFYL